MILKFSKSFGKQVQKLPPSQKNRLKRALALFQEYPQHPSLYNHPLNGQWSDYRSISFGGDWRAHYELLNQDIAHFVAVGTHSQLYK